MSKHPREKLTALALRKLGPGRHADGEGLYMLVDATGGRRWLLRTVIHGRRCDIGLGTVRFGDGELAKVRERSRALRDVARAGGDPLAERRAELAVRIAGDAAALAKQTTFREFADEYVKIRRSEWSNPKHAAQWSATLEAYAFPIFGDVPVPLVDVEHVVTALKVIWTTKPETASRVRGRIAAILDAAKARKLRVGDNPADWRGALQASLPALKKASRVVHHAALPYTEVGAFMRDLAKQSGQAASALRIAILTAARTGEIIGARWSEFDLDGEAVWNIPAERMKAKKAHRVPLSKAVVDILASLPRDSVFVFPGPPRRDGEARAMSNMSMLMVLRRMERTDVTVHGMRSSFRDWAGEQTAYPREVIEHALAHQLADAAEAAYQRGDLLRKRRALMDDWATYALTPRPARASVTPICTKLSA